jgi:branched-chain amino acid aminotransferase
MEPMIYIDGKYYPKPDACINVFDHGLLYGDGVFEGIRAYQRCVFRLRHHLERLYDSARYLMIEIPLSPQELAEAVKETCRRNGAEDYYIRLVVTRGVGDLGMAPWKCPKATIICIADVIKLYPREFYEDGLHIVTASTNRSGAETLNPRVKSLNYLNNILARIEAHNAGSHEAIMINHEGYVVEATGDNIFLVKNGILFTPPIWIGALRGITRDAVIEVAAAEGIAVREEPFSRYEVFAADEMFLSGTAAEVIPVTQVDGRVIGSGTPGEITRRLMRAYHALAVRDGEKF